MPSNHKRLFAIIIVVIIILSISIAISRKDEEVPEQILDSEISWPVQNTIGTSVEGRKIDSYTYGNGKKKLVFIGGIHGGYEWNSVLLAYRFIDYLNDNDNIVPENITITVIPNVNPDGVYVVTEKEGRFSIDDVSDDSKTLASGRFNADNIDLNRNFDCKWQTESTWQDKIVDAGKEAFSEPETMAIRNFIFKDKPTAVIFWHSKSNAVYASQCEDGILPETLAIMNVYSKASQYPAVKEFTAYVTTGAADDWLASIGIPAITVELATHENIEWNSNLAGIKALLEYYTKK